MPAPALRPTSFEALAARDDFETARLSPVWNFLRNPRPRDWSLSRRSGHLRLVGSRVTLDDVDSPALVLRRQQHFRMRCRAELDFVPRRSGEEAGLVVRGNERFYYGVLVRLGEKGREACLVRRVRGQRRVLASVGLGTGPVRLEIRADEQRYTFRAGLGERTRALGELPCWELSAETLMRAGRNCFTGVTLGMYATGNGRRSTVPADFDWFEYAPHR